MRGKLQAILDGERLPAVRLVIYAMIVLSAGVLALRTVPDLPEGAQRALLWLGAGLTLLFAVEFAVRLYAAPNRWRYLFSFWGIIDLLACLPLLVLVYPELQAMRVLRLMRLFRLLKLLRLAPAYARLTAALVRVRGELILFTLVALLALYLCAVGIYAFEHRAQPDVFTSIPASLWWALATLTTVGYGDMVPITAGGRLFTACVLFIGLGIVAVPAGIVTSALLNAPQPDDMARDTSDGENVT
ncbi:ion transporter [Pseudaestuariivita sp.]|uniref:ion transporter n=1 Tax=Pseudaestuariivita sp. TaxID=2211669 RepID=UPI004059AD69